MAPKLNPVHHLFIQSLISHRGVLSDKSARKIFDRVIQIVDYQIEQSRDPYGTFLGQCDDGLSLLGFNILRAVEQGTIGKEEQGRNIVCLVNVSADDISQVATTLTPLEISYLRVLIDHMFAPGNDYHAVSNHKAYSLSSAQGVGPGSLTKKEAQSLLSRLVGLGWLVTPPPPTPPLYTLSTHALLELGKPLKARYSKKDGNEAEDEDEDFESTWIECQRCRFVVTQGYQCPTRNCRNRLHFHCHKLCLQRKDQCRDCEQQWNDSPKLIGLNAVPRGSPGGVLQDDDLMEEDEEDEGRKKSQAKGKGKAKRKSRASMDDDDDEEEEDVDGEGDGETTGRKSSRAGLRKGMKSLNVAEDEDEDELATQQPNGAASSSRSKKSKTKSKSKKKKSNSMIEGEAEGEDDDEEEEEEKEDTTRQELSQDYAELATLTQEASQDLMDQD